MDSFVFIMALDLNSLWHTVCKYLIAGKIFLLICKLWTKHKNIVLEERWQSPWKNDFVLKICPYESTWLIIINYLGIFIQINTWLRQSAQPMSSLGWLHLLPQEGLIQYGEEREKREETVRCKPNHSSFLSLLDFTRFTSQPECWNSSLRHHNVWPLDAQTE